MNWKQVRTPSHWAWPRTIWGDGSEGATSADVYLMDPPANYKEYVVEDMEER